MLRIRCVAREEMKRFAAVMLVFAMTAFGQDMESCKQAILDPNYQVPPTLQIGDASYQQTRRITLLFSKDGIDFYGADRAKALLGDPLDENGAWIVGIFRDENARRAEIPQIMMRTNNPNLVNDTLLASSTWSLSWNCRWTGTASLSRRG